MALNKQQKEALQKIKDDLDTLEYRKARKQAGALFPAEVPNYEKQLVFDYGVIMGYVSAIMEVATEAQAKEFEEKVQKYVDKIPYQ